MIRFGTGTYNVRDTEGVRPELPSTSTSKAPINLKPSTSMLKCKVFFLDDTEHEFYFHKNAFGEELLEKIYAHVELVEKDFFGLQFVSILDVNSSGSRMKWLDAKKSIKRQMVCPPYHLFFRVKFYVNDPSKLIEEYTRYQFYLQLRKDLLEGRLPCTDEEAAILGSYAAQSEIGDYSPEEHSENYLDSLHIVPNQKSEVSQRIAELHHIHVGLVPAEAEFKFLDVAKHLNLYGFDLYEAKDGNDADICIGVNSNGISIFQSGIKLSSFPWAAIIKISFKRKQFYIQMKTLNEKRDQVDTVLVFNAVSSRNSKLLWKSCIECHTFFRLIAPPTLPQKSLFHIGSRFRYSGRTEYQTVEEMRRKARVEKNFNRHCSMTAGSKYRNEIGIDGPQSSSMSTASNSSAFSATSAADFASKFSRCRRLIPNGGRAASFLRENIIRKKMAQFTEMNPTLALPSFFRQFIPRSSSTFKLNQQLTRPDEAEFADDECESAALSLNPQRRSFIGPGINPINLSTQSVVLRNPPNGSTLSVRPHSNSRNSSILGVDDVSSPVASSQYSNATVRSSLIFPTSNTSSQQYCHGYLQPQIKEKHRYHSPSPYDSASTTLVASSLSNSTEDSARIWQGPNHTTMIINDPGSQACTSSVHHHHRNSIALTPNGCRKSMVLNGTQSALNGIGDISSNGDKHATYSANMKNIYQLQNGITNSDYSDNSAVLRKSMVNTTSPYKNNSRLMQSNNKIINGSGSPRSSIASFTINGTSNGYENGSSRGRQSPTRQHSNSPTSITSEDSAVVVRMTPDHQGRFGFNVSGGYDRGHPVIVSRVVAGSPADKCHPRLNVGDMVLKINGQDISSWSYERVVNCIRSIRSSSNFGEIHLTIKPNVYRCGEFEDSDQSQIVPEVTHVAETVPRSDKLAQSLLLLKESLETGKIVRQFDQLYRKKPGMTMNDSRTSANINKNRYRDVVPYDTTRVYLERAPSGDYINANHVNMEIPSSGIVNRYIACQGPLANTAGDFWYMIWEQGCTTIVMLTTLVEKGRIKCNQYWPSKRDSLEFGNIIITNVSEKTESHCHYREIAVKNKTTREERMVTQMQYTSWPDHGVPENPKHFIEFVAEVRRARNGSLDPIIVHCSAGIGRTGVLILMETASCLIEANEPVYPLDIVRTMRDQRAMLIQTSDQYTFVCESILRAYKENVVRPLAEYQKSR